MSLLLSLHTFVLIESLDLFSIISPKLDWNITLSPSSLGFVVLVCSHKKGMYV